MREKSCRLEILLERKMLDPSFKIFRDSLQIANFREVAIRPDIFGTIYMLNLGAEVPTFHAVFFLKY